MKKKIVFLLAALLLPIGVFAQNAQLTPEAREQEEISKIFYTIGYSMGENVKGNLVSGEKYEQEAKKFLTQGMVDSLTDKNPQVNQEEYQAKASEFSRKKAKERLDKQLTEQKKFAEAFKKERNTKELDGGIIVQTLSKGKGKKPGYKDTVRVHYKGTLIDGREFDSSYKRGEPTEFPLEGVIYCWTKGIQEMSAGGKAKLLCPPDTAYGGNSMGIIKPYSMLLFEVELLDVLNN